MKPRSALGVLLLMFGLVGCAHGPMKSASLAGAAGTVCKHCNCFMPADVDPQTTCPVCHCHRLAHACRRGR